MQFILDVGSHSLKLYQLGASVELSETITWDPWGDTEGHTPTDLLGNLLRNVQRRHPGGSISAFGTEVMRRDTELARQVSASCLDLGVEFRVISQDEEAALIFAAVEAEGRWSHDIVNVGGGSIQMVLGASGAPQAWLLDFGIVDLNTRFNLLGEPDARDIAGCRQFVAGSLPEKIRRFMYTGGELTYLRHFGVPLVDGHCDHAAFGALARRLERLSVGELVHASPFDPNWMKGAIASNCIVQALLDHSGVEQFAPSDLNIGHGLAAQVAETARTSKVRLSKTPS